jgi:hypothetical protein
MPGQIDTETLSFTLPLHLQSDPFGNMAQVYKKEEDMPSKPLVVSGNANFLFGADPEGFIFDGDTPVPASEAGLPGTKQSPFEVMGGAIQIDGMAAEFNIDPAPDFETWNDNIETAMAELEALVTAQGLTIKYVPSVQFPKEVFDKARDDDKELGCQPDLDAWSGGVNPPPMLSDELMYTRCAGGHLHVGWTENEKLYDLQHVLACQDLVKQFDWYLGAWSVLQDPDNIRRKLYGKMGACRYKPYGVEYRVLSNFWVNSKALRLEAWNRMIHAINGMSTIYLPERIPNELTDRLRKMINESQTDDIITDMCRYPLETLNLRSCQW